MENAPNTPSPLAAFWQQLRKPLERELARGCRDDVIVASSLGEYARLWAQRLPDGTPEDTQLALSIARGLRDYARMDVTERRRRAMAAIDLLRQREEQGAAPRPPARPAPRKAAPAKPAKAKAPAKAAPAPPALPTGTELLELPVALLAPRARWPRLLADQLNVYTVRDLLYHIPRDWVEITAVRDVADGARAALVGSATFREYEKIHAKKVEHPLYKYTLGLDDGTGEAWIVSFSSEPDRAKGQKSGWKLTKLPFTTGQRLFVLGKVDRTGKLVQVRMEDAFPLSGDEEAALRPGTLVPLYPLTNGVYQSQLHRAILRVLASLGTNEATNAHIDPLPRHLREEFGLLPLTEALLELHRPNTPLRHQHARKRLAFEEFLVPQLLLAQRRWQQHHTEGAPVFAARESMPELLARMVFFPPTAAQLRVLAEIEEDLRSPRPMNRLLQGDVGSGKTLVAAGALAFAVRSGLQAAIMAPTEILAEQLYLVLSHLLMPMDIKPVLLTGSVPAAEKRAAGEALAAGTAAIAVGTHALIQEGVVFNNLGLVVIDEQHRFGVLQRATLRAKSGGTPDTLVMTATPIPRTLSLTLFGDLDISVLDELPPGRHPVETRWVPNTEVAAAYEFIRGQIAEGRQAYVLCPLVEQSDLLQADAATEMAAELQKHVFPTLNVGLLHGRMAPEEKDAAMEAFRTGQTHILACTTVIEVGVDVPNATVMLIHNAERFGLSQLHQLRGRVGRAQYQSYCLLVTHPRFNPLAEDGENLPGRRRLRIMLDEQDGFAIAEADLQLRGPGEYLGTRQSGMEEFKIGNLLRDGKYLEQARQAAQALVAEDPQLAAPALAELRRRVNSMKARLDQFRE